MTISRLTRTLTLLLAAIQFAAPGLVSIADGLFAVQVADAVMHVESSSGENCEPPHAADCTVCRFLSGDTGLDYAVALEQAPRAMVLAPRSFARDTGASVFAATRARAPPTV